MSNAKTNGTPADDKAEAARREEVRTSGQFNADLAAEAAPGDRVPDEDLKRRQDRLLDEAIEETFPASDPISPKRITK